MGKKVSNHLYHLQQHIEPEDLLKILRFIAPQGRDLAAIYGHQPILCTNVNSITKQEFDYIYANANTEKTFESWLDGFTREEIVNRVGSAIKIISSMTKTEIIRQISRDKEILFRFFKKEFIEKYCSKWYEFKRGKEFLPAVSDNTKSLVFKTGCKYRILSASTYLQYWQLKYGDCDLELDKFFKTGIIDDNLVINLRDSDDCIIKNIQRFIRSQAKDAEFEIEHLGRGIDEDDLELKKAETIEYSLDLSTLTEYFGLRKVSKFKTFSEGLRKRKESKAVNNYLSKRFLITSSNHDIYCGISHDKDLFEKLAWHLKIEYLKDQKILCKVTEDETQETISALWEIMTEDKRRHSFCFVEL